MDNIDDLVYAILHNGVVVLGKLYAEPEPFDAPTVATGGDSAPALFAMAFPATIDNYEALTTLYADINVPELPRTPNEVMDKLLQQVTYIFAKVSAFSYADARDNGKMRAVKRRPDGETSSRDTKNFYVPYDAHGNEIKTV